MKTVYKLSIINNCTKDKIYQSRDLKPGFSTEHTQEIHIEKTFLITLIYN